MSGTPKMRTLPECVRELKDLDPDTAVTLTALRRLVKQGQVPVMEIASKQLVNLNLLLDMLSNPQTNKAAHEPMSGKIRAVSERMVK